MRLRYLMVTVTAAALSACQITLSAPAEASPTPGFVTATLPATRTPFATPTSTPNLTGTPGLSMTAPANCKNLAVLLQDVTIPDGTNIAYGTRFTKTWQFRNTGTCPWIGYKIAFASGDRMGAPDTAPIPDTAPKSDVNVSVELTAPTTDGIYSGFFELRDASGSPISIGIERTFWVKITVGNATVPTLGASINPVPTISGTLTSQKPPASCTYTTSGSYPNELVQLINTARADAGLPALIVNAQLAAAAQAHSTDMACFGLRSHTGSDGSSPEQRIAASGFAGSHTREVIYGGYGAYPLNAFTYWMNEPSHHAVLLDPALTHLGAGYAYVEDSSDGNYYTVDFGSQ